MSRHTAARATRHNTGRPAADQRRGAPVRSAFVRRLASGSRRPACSGHPRARRHATGGDARVHKVDELLLGVDAELRVHVPDVRLDGVARQDELLLDVRVVAPPREQFQHVALAWGEAAVSSEPRARAAQRLAGRRRRGLGDLAGHGERPHGLDAVDRVVKAEVVHDEEGVREQRPRRQGAHEQRGVGAAGRAHEDAHVRAGRRPQGVHAHAGREHGHGAEAVAPGGREQHAVDEHVGGGAGDREEVAREPAERAEGHHEEPEDVKEDRERVQPPEALTQPRPQVRGPPASERRERQHADGRARDDAPAGAEAQREAVGDLQEEEADEQRARDGQVGGRLGDGRVGERRARGGVAQGRPGERQRAGEGPRQAGGHEGGRDDGRGRRGADEVRDQPARRHRRGHDDHGDPRLQATARGHGKDDQPGDPDAHQARGDRREPADARDDDVDHDEGEADHARDEGADAHGRACDERRAPQRAHEHDHAHECLRQRHLVARARVHARDDGQQRRVEQVAAQLAQQERAEREGDDAGAIEPSHARPPSHARRRAASPRAAAHDTTPSAA